MPIFEYRCDDCGASFEKLMRRDETDGLECPACGQKHLTQQFSTFAAHAGSPAARAAAPACPSGMCSNPAFCGRN
ncbi:MAG: zinc ribbon domain-containing protein [Acidobacteria bacterium]|nr:zinc ribbon domain-containing protein [Acidobacteriota bacterium]